MSTLRKAGFTVIELMLAMSFVSVLLISVAVLSMNINDTYTRGVTYKELNQTGVETIDDIERTARESNITDLKYINDGNYNRLCFGRYSYVWNEVNDAQPTETKIGSTGGAPVRLAKVSDPEQNYCENPASTTIVPSDQRANQLLGLQGQRDLYVYNISISPLEPLDPDNAEGLYIAGANDLNTGRGLYTIKMTLGSGDSSQIDLTTDPQCRPPADAHAGDEYCAVNVFTAVVAMGSTYIP